LETVNVRELVDWCHDRVDAGAVAVDAPCRWSTDGRSRPAERETMNEGIWCFSTPTRQTAVQHSTNHFGWMRNGEALYRDLEKTYQLCSRLPAPANGRFCFETYPHAITWQLMGGGAVARRKRQQRRAVLTQVGIDLTELTNIDLVDAALCALTAYLAATREACTSFGEPDTGLIIVPAMRNR
jgi:predicted RNase H-like nuclease